MTWDWRLLVAPGSALFVLPLAAAIGLLLLRQAGTRGAVLRWWCALVLAATAVAASKIAFYGWGTGIRAWNLTCFSGHTVLALGFWPVALALLVPPRRRAWRRGAAALGWGFGLLIGYSRLPLGAHPVSEVLAGVALGGATALYGLHVLRGRWLPPRSTALLAALGLLALLWLSQRTMPTLPSERWFAAIGTTLSGRDAPVDHRTWKL
jgi:membrane-associated phospholipid phosphatase